MNIMDSLFLYSDLNYDSIINGDEIELTKDHFLTVSYNEKLTGPCLDNTLLEYQKRKFIGLIGVVKPSFSSYNSSILRSAMTLKLLTFEKTGAVLAAATTSLPETIGRCVTGIIDFVGFEMPQW